MGFAPIILFIKKSHPVITKIKKEEKLKIILNF